MRYRPLAFLACLIVLFSCANGPIQNLPLRWKLASPMPAPSASVGTLLSTMTLAVALRDVRPDPSAVGLFEDDGFVVRTTDNVGQYCADRMAEMLAHAGAQLATAAPVELNVELLDYQVREGERFNALVRLRVTVQHNGGPSSWMRLYTGKGSRWGRTHNPENFNEALSDGLADVVAQMLADDSFAMALTSAPALPPAVPPGS